MKCFNFLLFRYMVLGRDKTFFHPTEVEVLKLGDGNPQSKKDASVRRAEIQSAISNKLCETIVHNIEYWSRNPQWTLFLGAAVGALPTAAHRREALQALAQHCGEVMPPEVNSLIDIAHSSKMLSYVITNDANNKLIKMPIFSLMLLAAAKKVRIFYSKQMFFFYIFNLSVSSVAKHFHSLKSSHFIYV